MIIAKRTSTGWVNVNNKQKNICDRCSNKLWIAPNGKIYCDKEKCGNYNCAINDNKKIYA